MIRDLLSDEIGDGYTVFVSASERVTLSAPLWSFFQEAAHDGVKPVLVTTSTAHVSWFVVEEMRRAGGFWAVRAAEKEVYDGRTGYRIWAFKDLWGPVDPQRPRLASLNELAPNAVGAFFFDSFTRERAEERTLVGRTAEYLISGFGGGSLARWDEMEPLASPWSCQAITQSTRAQMPASQRHLIRSDRGATASLTVARTRTGLLENTRGLVPVGPYGSPNGLPPGAPLAAHPAISSTLRGMAERFRPNVVMVSYSEVDWANGALGQRVHARRMDQPLAVLIGPVAVRDLALDVEDLSRRHDVTPMGLRRAPSVMVRFSGPDGLWRQLVTFANDLDEERLATALGLDAHESKSMGG